MSDYYLISQLPSLDGLSDSFPPPISEKRFTELCEQFAAKRVSDAVKALTLLPPREHNSSGFALIDRWNESERNLRLALGKIRAEKMKKEFDLQNRALPAEYIKTAAEAAECENPLKAETYLNRFRFNTLEKLRPADNFSSDYLFYYGLKLKLLERICKFDKAIGEEAYRKIYHSVTDGEETEAKQ